MDDRIWISIDTETSEGQGERRWTEGFSTTWISLADCHKFLPLCSLFQCTSRRVLVLKSSARGLVTVRSCRRRDGYARKRFGRRNFLYQRRHFSTTCHVLKPSCPFPGQTEPYGTSYRLPIPLIDDAPLLFDDEHPVLGEPHRDRSRQVHPPPPLVGGRPDLSRHLARSARFVQAPFVDEVDHRSLDVRTERPSRDDRCRPARRHARRHSRARIETGARARLARVNARTSREPAGVSFLLSATRGRGGGLQRQLRRR